MMESFLWAAKETLKRRGMQFEGTERVPKKPELWMFLYRGIVALASALLAWLLIWLVPSRYGAATAATIAVLAVWFYSGLTVSGAEYELAKTIVPTSDDADYDAKRSFALYLLLLVLRPLCVWILCLHFNLAWLLAAMLLAAVSVQSLLAGGITQLKVRPQWTIAIVASLVACGVSAHWTYRPAWLLLTLLAALIAAILPQTIASRIPENLLHTPQKRKVIYYFFEMILLLLGLLEMAA